jgi:hypothetical protein
MVAGFVFFYLYFAWTRSLLSVLNFNWMSGLFNRILMIFISAGILGASVLYIIPNSYDSRLLYLTFAFISFVFISAEKYLIKRVSSGYVRKTTASLHHYSWKRTSCFTDIS